MVPRQVWLFQLGCWVALAAAVARVIAHVASPSVGADAVAGLAPTHVLVVPGLRQPTFLSVIDGFSLSVAMLTATLGASGLVVLRYAADLPLALRGVARVYAIGTAMLLVVSIADLFSVDSFLIATMVMCFGLASVAPEEHDHSTDHAPDVLPRRLVGPADGDE